MKKYILGILLAGSLHLEAQSDWCYIPDGQTVYSEICCPADCCPPTCNTPCSPFPVLLVDLQGGARRDSFSFSVRGPGGVPNRQIRQRYPRIKSTLGAVNVWLQLNKEWYLRGYADYSYITHGKEKQSFYNSQQSLIYRYDSQANSGYLYDFSGGLGWALPCLPNWFTVAAVGGYSREGQYIRSSHAKRTTPQGNQEHISGRHSKLQMSWTGPWAGTDVAIRYGGLKVGGTFEYHWARFRATEHQDEGGNCVQNCNLKNKFHASGQGLVFGLTATQLFCDNWRFGFVGKLQYWKTKSGHYSADGEKLRLNPVSWNSGSLAVNLGYRF